LFETPQVVSLMKNEQQSQNLLFKVDPRSNFRNNLQQNVLLRDKLIIQGEKHETSTQNLQHETMLGDKLRVFAAFKCNTKERVLIAPFL